MLLCCQAKKMMRIGLAAILLTAGLVQIGSGYDVAQEIRELKKLYGEHGKGSAR